MSLRRVSVGDFRESLVMDQICEVIESNQELRALSWTQQGCCIKESWRSPHITITVQGSVRYELNIYLSDPSWGVGWGRRACEGAVTDMRGVHVEDIAHISSAELLTWIERTLMEALAERAGAGRRS